MALWAALEAFGPLARVGQFQTAALGQEEGVDTTLNPFVEAKSGLWKRRGLSSSKTERGTGALAGPPSRGEIAEGGRPSCKLSEIGSI